ncbi:hypothetical protein L218DRAFT_955597 [Marasmius fiardii PR-910]|nr:hypothetical protein L218DRAFT_955597 [Marasmius fiardii PR-910]
MTSKSDSSRSTSPLTPESTGTNQTSSPDSSLVSTAETEKKRRQTAFYPNVNSSNKTQKPFSRSAAKRQSVMALGSIEHLQYYFTKTGLQAKQKPSVLDKTHYGVVPAIGGGDQLKLRTSITSISDITLPPTPAIPSPIRPSFPEVQKTFEVDPEYLKPGLIEDLILVSRVWCIDTDQSRPDDKADQHFDVLGTLQATTRAIRSVRNYVLTLPVESVGNIGELFRSSRLSAATRKTSSSNSSSSTKNSHDPLVSIRRSALEVLAILRELEERYRLPLSDDAYDAQSDSGKGSVGSHSRVSTASGVLDDLERDHHTQAELEGLHDVDADTSVAFSLVRVEGRDEQVPVWEDEENDDALDDTEEKRERWDERLVLGSGWLYRQDVTINDLQKEKATVAKYLDIVDEILFSGGQIGDAGRERSWLKEKRRLLDKKRPNSRSKTRRTSAGDVENRGLGLGFSFPDAGSRRRVSTGMLNTTSDSMRLPDEPSTMEGIAEEEGPEEEAGDRPHEDGASEDSLDDEELPEWAQRNAFLETPLDRCRALIHDLLPPNLQNVLPSEGSSREALLASLSSGQLLCIAYNAGVRKSKKAWGYVSKDGIHDLIELEKEAAEKGDTKAKTGWTFRRSDNLRLWVGALKLRYMLPIVTPAIPAGPRPPNSKPPSTNNTPLTSPVTRKFPTDEPPILFDAKVVAKRDAGWEDMLERVLLRWMWRVVDEQRSIR